MSDFEVSGGCLCRAVRYRVSERAKSVEHCHCSMCRRAHGALSAAGALVSAASFRIVEGREHLRPFASSPGNHRWFCARCGCHLYMSVDHIPSELYYWAASLDEGMSPGHPLDSECHIFVASKACWDRCGENLPLHDTTALSVGIGH